jgi:DNA-binding Xre family transcriptional regulator
MLREMADLSPANLTKLNKNEHVSMGILERICEALDCNIGDIVDKIDEDNEDEADDGTSAVDHGDGI